jgi:hypothetical protein
MIMKRTCFLFAVFFATLTQTIAAEPAVSAAFVSDATTGISRAVFDTISRFYKQGFPPGELSPSKEFPVRIAFSESDVSDLKFERTYKSVNVSGVGSIAAKRVKLIVDDTEPAANKERAENPNVWVAVRAGRLRVEHGTYECTGTFLANGKKVLIVSGEAKITNSDGSVVFSNGAKVVVDGRLFTYSKGKWVASAEVPVEPKK